MGRTILADDRLQTYVEDLLSTNTWYIGLVIGKFSTNQKDYVIHLVRTPEPVEDKASSDDDDADDSPVKPSKDKTQTKPSSLESLNEMWAATHAKQVTMMLTGGLSVMGIFAVAPPTMMHNAQAKLKQVLFAIYKQERKAAQTSSSETSERVLIQFCHNTQKHIYKTLDVADPRSVFRPADWKYSPLSERWTRLESNVSFKIPIDIPGKSTANIAKQLQTGLQPFYDRINGAMVLIENSSRNGNELLDQSTEKRHTDKKSKSKDRTISQQSYQCKVISKMVNSSSSTPKSPTLAEYSTQLVIKGSIHSRAYVTGKPTVEDAINAVKQDVIRSVSCRCELMCDDLQVVEEDTERQEVYSTPRRVFFKLPGTTVNLCDYMFQDEKVTEVIKRIQELLDIKVTEDDLDLACEHPATEEDCSLYSQEDVVEESTAPVNLQPANSIKYYLMAGVGGMVGAFAAGVSYMMSENT